MIPTQSNKEEDPPPLRARLAGIIVASISPTWPTSTAIPSVVPIQPHARDLAPKKRPPGSSGDAIRHAGCVNHGVLFSTCSTGNTGLIPGFRALLGISNARKNPQPCP